MEVSIKRLVLQSLLAGFLGGILFLISGIILRSHPYLPDSASLNLQTSLGLLPPAAILARLAWQTKPLLAWKNILYLAIFLAIARVIDTLTFLLLFALGFASGIIKF